MVYLCFIRVRLSSLITRRIVTYIFVFVYNVPYRQISLGSMSMMISVDVAVYSYLISILIRLFVFVLDNFYLNVDRGIFVFYSRSII